MLGQKSRLAKKQLKQKKKVPKHNIPKDEKLLQNNIPANRQTVLMKAIFLESIMDVITERSRYKTESTGKSCGKTINKQPVKGYLSVSNNKMMLYLQSINV